jgi:hypothetical protein
VPPARVSQLLASRASIGAPCLGVCTHRDPVASIGAPCLRRGVHGVPMAGGGEHYPTGHLEAEIARLRAALAARQREPRGSAPF